ncbi:MAG: LPXTG cell wall anchor domain-containing protein, partial [Anaerotruncus sp.]|nr:LPXTG cell wall anchor domain-containing protein [Anaerotruncus sp.]
SGSEVENDETGSTPEADKNNPGTGASDMINAAVMAAIASMTAAGLAIYKKNER